MVLIFNGSPRKGNSYKCVELLKQTLSNVEVINAYEHQVNSCIDCVYCKSNLCKCFFDDDMNNIYKKISEAKYIIIVGPIHLGVLSAGLAVIFSRLQTFFVNRYLFNNSFPFEGKKGISISFSGTDWKKQKMAYDLNVLHAFKGMNVDAVSNFHITDTDKKTYEEINQEIDIVTKEVVKYVENI